MARKFIHLKFKKSLILWQKMFQNQIIFSRENSKLNFFFIKQKEKKMVWARKFKYLNLPVEVVVGNCGKPLVLMVVTNWSCNRSIYRMVSSNIWVYKKTKMKFLARKFKFLKLTFEASFFLAKVGTMDFNRRNSAFLTYFRYFFTTFWLAVIFKLVDFGGVLNSYFGAFCCVQSSVVASFSSSWRNKKIEINE